MPIQKNEIDPYLQTWKQGQDVIFKSFRTVCLALRQAGTWDLDHFAAVLASGQTSPLSNKIQRN